MTVPPVPKTYKPAETPWGEPDFRGGWPVDHLNQTPLQRTPAQGNRYYLTDEEYAAREKQIGATAARYDNEQKNNRLGMGAWMESGKPNRLTSMVIDPPNGRLPGPDRGRHTPLQDHEVRRSARPDIRLDRRFRQLGPLHHARHAGLDVHDQLQ